MNNRIFSEKIVEWYREYHRDLPWRNTQEPYKIWLSEIILQQTRVIQGLPYYEKFIQEFPEINSLARAKEEKVLRLWQGLGYYTRARNLHKCAVEIVRKFNGIFPPAFNELKKLPGVGDYTAAAIASFAFGERVAVVDGNVQRVLSRVFGITENVSTPSGKKYFFEWANTLISADDPGRYNQAIMEFGALQCVPRNPKCDACIFSASCFARRNQQQHLFPVKRRPAKVTHRYLYYFIFSAGRKFLMKKRLEKDIWNSLYDFPLRETKRSVSHMKIQILFPSVSGVKVKSKMSKVYKHVLTHQIIHARFIHFEIPQAKSDSLRKKIEGSGWFSQSQIARLPKPVLISRFLHDDRIL